MHTEFTRLMSLVLDHEATPDEVARLQAHLALCPACCAVWVEWNALDRRLADAPMMAPSRNLVPAVMARLAERQAPQRRRWWLAPGLLLVWAAAAAALFLAVALLIWWGWQHPLEAALVISTAAQLLSGVVWWLRGMETVFGLFNGPAAALAVSIVVAAVSGLGVLWALIFMHSQRRVGQAIPAGKQDLAHV